MDKIMQWLGILGTFALGNILPAVIIAAVGLLVIQLVNRLVKSVLEKSRLEKAAHGLIKSVISIVLYVLLGLIVASKLGIDVTGIVALASVLTLAVSLAVQNLLANVIGGFQLLSTKPFTTGDYVEIAGQSGTVQQIGLTYTQLATPDNKLISIPNSAVVAAQIVNYTVTGTRRVDVNVSAAYSMPVEQVLEALKEAGNVPAVLADPELFVAVTRYGESAIEYTLRFWTTTDDYWPTYFEVLQRVKQIFDARGIEMTYPHLNVHLDK